MAVAFRAGSAVDTAQTSTSTNTVNITIAQATVAGNSLLVAVSSASARTVSTITDSAGNIWSLLNRQANGSSATTEIWGVLKAKSLAIGNTVTVTCSANGRFTTDFGEYSGISAFGVTSGATGATSPTTTGAVTVEASGDFLITAFGANANNTWTATSGTIRGQVGTTSTHGALIDATGSTTPTCSATMTADTWATASVDAKSTVVNHEEADSWWSGAQKSFASIALATALATGILTAQAGAVAVQQQDDPPVQGGASSWSRGTWPWRVVYAPSEADVMAFPPATPVDEDFWQSGVPPSPLIMGRIYLPDPEEVPGNLSGQPDEDYWQNPVRPVPATLQWPQPWTFDPVDSIVEMDEDFWQNRVPPVSLAMGKLYLPDPEENPAGSLRQVEEEFWQNQVAPVQTSLWQRLPIGDPEEIPAGSLYGLPEEDYWQLGPRPQQAINQYPQQWTFDPNDSIVEMDEDYWSPPIPPPSLPARVFTDDDVIFPTFTPDEDLWLPPVPLPPVQPRVLTDDEIIVPQPVTFTPDEDYWQLGPPAPQAIYTRLYSFEAEDVPTLYQLEEEYWRNSVAPVQGTNAYQMPWTQDPEFIGYTVEEDFWINSVAPVPSRFGRLYLPDPEEISAGNLHGQPDEDYWTSGVVPVPARFGSLYLPDPEQPPTSPGVAEEEYWQNPVAPVAASFGKLYLPDGEENPAGSLVVLNIEEEYWQNRVTPVVASLIWAQQWTFDVFDYVTPPQPFVPDEDFWLCLPLWPDATDVSLW